MKQIKRTVALPPDDDKRLAGYVSAHTGGNLSVALRIALVRLLKSPPTKKELRIATTKQGRPTNDHTANRPS